MIQDYPGIVILVSHNRDEVYRMSEELLILDDGKIAGQGATKQLFENPGNVVAARITGCKNIAEAKQNAEKEVYIKEWDLTLPIQTVPGKEIKGVAIHAHNFLAEKTTGNTFLCFPVLEPVITEDLFEYNISFKTSAHAAKRIDWKLPKNSWRYDLNTIPTEIYLNEANLLLLS